ncbi:MAG: GNAT family N-acetyltransferase [Gemmatimonadaceae bacterium]
MAAFPNFFMTQLGPSFLREYYSCVVDYSSGILLTESDVAGCVGFVAGFIDPPSFYRNLRRRRVRLTLAAVLQVVSQPRRLSVLFANYRRAGDAAHRHSEPDTAELSSLAVRPDAKGRGVGSLLVQRFIVLARQYGARRVVLTTDAADNDGVNRFYQRLGFDCVGTLETGRGRKLNKYSYIIGKV